MASSLFTNTLHVCFHSVLAVLYEDALTKFFLNGCVRDGKVVSTIRGEQVEISEEVFASTFELSVDGLMSNLSEIPKDIVFDARSIFSLSGEQVITETSQVETDVGRTNDSGPDVEDQGVETTSDSDGASEELVFGKKNEGVLNNTTNDEELMSVDDLLMQISNIMMLPSVTAAEVTKIEFGLTVEIHEVQDKDCYYASLPKISAHDKGKKPLATDDVVKGNLAREMVQLICRDVEFLVQLREQTYQADARKEAKEQKAIIEDMDERLANFRSEQLDFRAQAHENYNNLSSQLGELVAYINRGNDKKGEKSSSHRPQTPHDDQNSHSGGNASRGGGDDSGVSGRRDDRRGSSTKRGSGSSGAAGPYKKNAEWWLYGKTSHIQMQVLIYRTAIQMLIQRATQLVSGLYSAVGYLLQKRVIQQLGIYFRSECIQQLGIYFRSECIQQLDIYFSSEYFQTLATVSFDSGGSLIITLLASRRLATTSFTRKPELQTVGGGRSSIRSTTIINLPPSICTRISDGFCHGWNLLVVVNETSPITRQTDGGEAEARRWAAAVREV
ncbi:mucin-2-like [Dorcoceras hygrometricum]|uniref:Mucin-2-like n=1 Tax=Dorcoceras hygrometricum TaxID=472368 RepID=A0A2Z7BLL3_9LAMI|nr:mucin-2-like [Dorcoceras hygrometricum]